MSEALLAEGFEENERDAVGEVERPRFGVEHGNPQPGLLVCLEEGGGRPAVSRPNTR
jgi:hypothetical protein